MNDVGARAYIYVCARMRIQQSIVADIVSSRSDVGIESLYILIVCLLEPLCHPLQRVTGVPYVRFA